MPWMPEMSGVPGMSLRPSSDVNARESLVSDGPQKKKFNGKLVLSSYSWQDVRFVLINTIPGHVATKNEIVKELKTFQRTVIAFGM